MPAFIDYAGRRIGRTVVLELATKSSVTKWKCRCDCGNEFICRSTRFVRGDHFECKFCWYERRRGPDLTGRKFGRWTVLNREIDKNNKTVWICKCDCGNMGKVAPSCLGKKHRSMSCGCWGRKIKSKYANDTLYPPAHKFSRTNLYAIRTRILNDCYNPKVPNYKNHGGKGHTICELWKNGAKDFCEWGIKEGWKSGMVLVLKDGETEFSPQNCYWLSESEFCSKLQTKIITHNGEKKSSAEWAKVMGIENKTLLWRLRKGYSIEEAIFLKPHAKSGGKKRIPDEKIIRLYETGLSVGDTAKELGMSNSAVSKRLQNLNIPIEQGIGRRKYRPPKLKEGQID